MEPSGPGEESRDVPTLFTVCAQNVSENMVRLEQRAWGLPTPILRQLLQFLNIYDLERIEEVAVKKGISTRALWLQLWKDVIGTNPKVKTEPFNWRQKFLQTFFHGVLWGTLDILKDKRLNNSRSSALVLGSRHVSKLVIRNKLQGVKELADNPSICNRLTCTVHKMVFQHLRSVDLILQHSLLMLLHSLVHHGVVKEVALSHWNEPHPELLALILRTSAGLWREGKMEYQGIDCCGEDKLKMDIKAMKPTVQRNILDCCHQQAEKTAYCTLSDWIFTTTESNRAKKIMTPSVNVPSDSLISPHAHCVTSEESSCGELWVVDGSSCRKTHGTYPKKRKSCGTMCGALRCPDVQNIVSEMQPFSGSRGMALTEPDSCAHSNLLEQRPSCISGKTCDESNCNGQKILKGQLYSCACSRVVKEPGCPDQHHNGSEEKRYSHDANSRMFIESTSSAVDIGTSKQLVSHYECTNAIENQDSAITEELTCPNASGSFSEGPGSPEMTFGESESTNAHGKTLEEPCLLNSSTWIPEDLVSCFTNNRTCKKPRLADVCNIKSAEKSKTGLSEVIEKPGDIYDYIFMIGGSKTDTEQNTSGTDENSDDLLEGLGPAIFLILKELCVLSRCHDNRLSTLVLKDDILHLPMIKLVKILLGNFPRLRTFHVGFLLEIQNESLENELLMATAEVTGSCLEDLSLSCTNKPLQVDMLLPVLRGLKFLRRLCLHRASFGAPEELGKLLHATTFFLSALDWITIQDVNLAVCFKEVLDLLHSAPLKGLTLDNCRLFERHAAETVSEIVTALKQNQSLKFLSLPANRLGNKGLLSLAKLFTEDSLSCISCLNVSANCIRGDGLLEFAKILLSSESERSGGLKLKELNISENLFFRDPAPTQEALELFKNKCHIITVQSLTDPLQAFADHISVM
uniref:leucine-rich repeat-containing protein 41 isoform X2 n=1 Tax=Pristiophorus japonicus TaxID=55135 RepID=UPI00398F499D